jgi:hypothetical protein
VSEPNGEARQWPTLRYETRDGEVVTVEADFISIAGPRDGEGGEHVLIINAVAVAVGCNFEAHGCRIEADGCFVEPLARDGGPRWPNAGGL